MSTVTSDSSEFKKCLSTNSQIVKNCKTYELQQNGALECSECNTGSTKSNVFANSETHARCLLNAIEAVEDCQTYTMSNVGQFVCTQCNDGFALKDAKKDKVCVSNDDL